METIKDFFGLSSKDKFSDWSEVGEDYEIVDNIGEGSYGAVVSAFHKPTNTKVAIKRMKNVFDNGEDCKRIM